MSNKLLLRLLAVLIFVSSFPVGHAQAAEATPSDVGLGMLAVAIAFAVGSMAAGFAIARAGSAGLAASAERPELRTTALIIAALGEALAIYAVVVVFQMLGKIPAPGG
jgi:F0F1-type ATP synthase membrane subunit c/vacuolar-type H+-ATPase subunit K